MEKTHMLKKYIHWLIRKAQNESDFFIEEKQNRAFIMLENDALSLKMFMILII